MVRKSLFLILGLCGIARADTGFTSTIKVTEADNAPSCIAGQLKFSNGTVTCSGQTATITNTGGSGGASTLQITRSGVEITSPTASINFYSGDFLANAIGTTAQIALNPATTDFIHAQSTLQSGATFYVSSGTALNMNVANNITFGQGSTAGANSYQLVFRDVGTILGAMGMTNDSSGFFMAAPQGTSLLSIDTATNGVGALYGLVRIPYGILTSSVTVNGAGNGSVELTISGSTYSVTASSTIATNTVGHMAVWSSTNGTLVDGGVSGGAPGGSSGQVQYNNAGSFGGITGSFVGTSSTTIPSIAVSTFVAGNTSTAAVTTIYASTFTASGMYSVFAGTPTLSSAFDVYVTTPGTNAIHISTSTGIVQLTTTTLSGYVSFFSKTLAQLQALTPSAVNQSYFCSNCTTANVCTSTAATVGSFSNISGKATACQ
jgi:hypothetical protein